MNGTHTWQLHSEYIVYVDESGDHGLTNLDPDYPIFVLSFCIFKKMDYVHKIAPAIRQLKFFTFGHDMVVLHESDIRRKKGTFAKLSKGLRSAFLNSLTDIMADADFTLIAVVIHKNKLRQRNAEYPYHIALQFGLERIFQFLKGVDQQYSLSYLVCESRRKKEDFELELEFQHIRNGNNIFNTHLPFEIILADKKTNSEGLQMADLTARPIGLKVLRPDQTNRAALILERKFFRNKSNIDSAAGLIVYP